MDMCKPVTYTALLQAHLQAAGKNPALPSSNSRLSCYAEGDELGQHRREGTCDDKSRSQELFALHLFEEVIRKKHSPLCFVVGQMFSGTSPAREALTLHTQQAREGTGQHTHPPPLLPSELRTL